MLIYRIFCILFIVFAGQCRLVGQNFEGSLTYKVELEILPKFEKMGMTKETVISKLKEDGSWAETQKISYKKNLYRIDLEANSKVWSIYRGDSNRIYTFQQKSDICSVTNASVDLEAGLTKQPPEVTLLDTLFNIGDKQCKIIRVKWKTGYFDYYFNQNYLKFNSEFYENHLYDGWGQYLKIANSLPIKIVKVVNGMMKTTSVLIDVKEEQIDVNLFSLPVLVPIDNSDVTLSKNKKLMKIKSY